VQIEYHEPFSSIGAQKVSDFRALQISGSQINTVELIRCMQIFQNPKTLKFKILLDKE
jgi:hypothetical protein